MDINVRTAMVTGPSSGIGRAIVSELLDQGVEVLGVCRGEPPAGFVDSGRYRHFRFDLERIDDIGALAAAVLDQGVPDAVVLNAGYGRFGALEEFSHRQIRTLIDVNLTANILLLRDLLPVMKQQPEGRVVIIGSESGLSGGRRGAVYCATKFALRGLAQSLREECAKSGIAITLINPGMTDTAFFDFLDFRPGRDADQHLEAADVARAVLHCLGGRPGAVVDEINLTPMKHVIRFGREDGA